jgi:hypothetical protein
MNIIKNNYITLIIFINLLLTIYLLIQNITLKKGNIDIFGKIYYDERKSIVDKDMIGLKYPEIQ